jgi:prepilin-type processing-associated H-X9-DG protein/prepilin-type N-terminal cleavage/methylation domain-containing protein
MKKRADRNEGFTLIELLVTIGIIACLASLLMPSIVTMRQKADNLKCISNLRQLGVSGILYANDHSQRLPVIEPWPDQPLYTPADNAGGLLQTLQPYGVTADGLKCPNDLKGPNYFAKEGSSYQWSVMGNGQSVQSVKFYFMGMQSPALPMSKVILAFDYTAVHNGGTNVLFGDGHVAQSGGTVTNPPASN